MSRVEVRKLEDGRLAAVIIFDEEGLAAINHWGLTGTYDYMPKNIVAAHAIAEILDSIDTQIDCIKENDDDYDEKEDEDPTNPF